MIRHASADDLKALAELEACCFPPQEAADEDRLRERIESYGSHFWLLEEDGRLVAFMDGFVSNEPDLNDSMYENAQAHQEDGDWQMIFGVSTHPNARHRGYASLLMKAAIEESLRSGKKGLVLTCKEELIPFYARFGFVDEGISASQHGQVQWHQMRLCFPQQPAMRRKDREVADPEELTAILRAGKIVHLGLMDEDGPYVVPLHYGCEVSGGTAVLYMHSAMEGHKLDLVRKDPRCFAEIDCETELLSGGDDPCRYGAAYASVMARGRVEILESTEEKMHGLQVLMRHQTGHTFSFSEERIGHVCVWKVVLRQITGKRRPSAPGQE